MNGVSGAMCYTYAKMDDMRTYRAMDINEGAFVGNLIYCTVLEDNEYHRGKLQELADMNREIGLVLQLRRNNKVIFETAS